MNRIVAVALLLVSLSACELVSISEDVSYDSEDRALPQATLNKIELGKTNKIWIEKYLGAPDSIEENKGMTTSHYRFSEQVAQRVRVFLLFQYKGSKLRERTLYVQFKDDIVQRAWLDGDDLLEPEEIGQL